MVYASVNFTEEISPTTMRVRFLLVTGQVMLDSTKTVKSEATLHEPSHSFEMQLELPRRQ